jgi:hypothetical protein
MRKLVLIPIVALCVASCGDLLTGTDLTEQPANLEFHGQTENVVAPTSATRGAAFNVTFTTYGGGCVERTENQVAVSGLEVHIFAIQVVKAPPCTDVLKTEAHTIPVTINFSGAATIYVHGWRQPQNQELIVVRSLTVAP